MRKNDEKAFGEYRTKRMILDVYDRMAVASRTGAPFQTSLDPLPGSLGASHAIYVESGIPKDYAEALRTGLLFALVRRAGDAGIASSALSRALLWLREPPLALSWLDPSRRAEFERAVGSDPLLANDASPSNRLLDALEDAKAITRDARGVVKLRAGSSIPYRLPQTPALAKLANVMIDALARAESGSKSSAEPAVGQSSKAKRA